MYLYTVVSISITLPCGVPEIGITLSHLVLRQHAKLINLPFRGSGRCEKKTCSLFSPGCVGILMSVPFPKKPLFLGVADVNLLTLTEI